MGEFKTKVSIARTDSPSLRTTIPEGVVQLINLKAGNELKWKIDIKNNKVDVKVSKA